MRGLWVVGAIAIGANHFLVTDPVDTTVATTAIDFAATQPATQLRDLVAEAIGLFIDAHIRDRATAADALDRLLNSEQLAIGNSHKPRQWCQHQNAACG
jgi:signal recognition particle receptor subunit beta